MRALRERPRLVAAQLTMAAFALATALLIGSALAGDNRDRESRLERQLAQASDRESDLGDQLDRTRTELDRTEAELDRTEAELDRLRLRLAVSDRTARARTRITRALRRELTATRRALRRARTP
jgi:septal ring factor EnvC (AmiA/AmiB activator)